jgi:hypothetical protein
MSSLEQNILEKQILKCDIVKDFCISSKTVIGMTNETTEIITSESHGLTLGNLVFVKGGDQTGLTFGTRYYIINPTTQTFQISLVNPLIDPISATAIDITAEITLSIIKVFGGYLVAEYNYLEFSDLPIEFSIIPTSIKPTDNKVILGYVTPSGDYLERIDTTNQTICELNGHILYEMNVDMVDGYHAGNESGTVAISNGEMCSGLNAEMINGYSGYQAAEKWQSNSGLNVEYIADEFGIFHQPGNGLDNLPLSNGTINVNLNSEFLSGSGYTAFEKANHIHSLDYVTDGPIFRRPLNVNVSHHLTNDSFLDGAVTKEKINNECFFARNDDLGGQIAFASGETILTTNYSVVTFTPQHPSNSMFAYPPNIMLQIVDTAGDYDEWDYVKIKAVDVTRTHFTVDYTSYSGVDGGQYSGITGKDLTLQWVALGYAVDDSDPNYLSRPI